jgi:hypothetical protein
VASGPLATRSLRQIATCGKSGQNITPPLGEDVFSADMDLAPDLTPDADMGPVA